LPVSTASFVPFSLGTDLGVLIEHGIAAYSAATNAAIGRIPLPAAVQGVMALSTHRDDSVSYGLH